MCTCGIAARAAAVPYENAPQDMDGAPHFGSWETFTAVDAGSGQAGTGPVVVAFCGKKARSDRGAEGRQRARIMATSAKHEKLSLHHRMVHRPESRMSRL